MEEEEVEGAVGRAVPPLSVVLLDDIARGVKKILAHLEEITAEGVDVPLPETTVTKVEYVDVSHVPLRSVDLFNKGPDTAYYRINNDAKEIPIEDREAMTIVRPRRTIVKITLRVDAGKSATIKSTGHY